MQTAGKKSGSGPKAAQKALKPDDPAQYKRFVEVAREAEADETQEGAEKAFRKIVQPPLRKKK